MAKKQEKTARRITSLDAFQTETFTAVIDVDGDLWEIPCRELTYVEFNETTKEITYPQPEEWAGPTGKVYLTNDPVYQQKRGEADQKVALRRVAKMMDFPDQTVDQKVEALSRAPMALVMGLTAILTRRHFAKEARIESLSHSFHSGGSGNGTHPETDGLDARVLAQPVGG